MRGELLVLWTQKVEVGHRAERPTRAPSETCPFLLAYAHITGELESRAVVSNSLRMQSVEFSRPEHWGNCSVSRLQGIFPTQEWSQGPLYHRQILYQLSSLGSPADMAVDRVLTG